LAWERLANFTQGWESISVTKGNKGRKVIRKVLGQFLITSSGGPLKGPHSYKRAFYWGTELSSLGRLLRIGSEGFKTRGALFGAL